jgi:hypothetical protein
MPRVTRRGFIKAMGLGAAGLALPFWRRTAPLPDFPAADRLGRVCVGKVDIRARADADSETVGTVYEDGIVPWLREKVGPNPFRTNQRWVETPDGYIWAAYLQPVQNRPGVALNEFPSFASSTGFWVRVSVPYVPIVLDNPPARSPWLKGTSTPRLYYSQILWVDEIKPDDSGGILYRINERYGYGDIFWAQAKAFELVRPEELDPISPEVEDKKIVVDVTYQTLSCFEGQREVYYCLISSGAKYNSQGQAVDKWATPLGPHPIWRKTVSLHMSGGTTGGGYDLPGIGWTSLFSGNGVAVHSTFWHNNFGEPMSHGCVNARPDDAHYVFRWSQPQVSYDPGDLTVGMPGGTKVIVIES